VLQTIHDGLNPELDMTEGQGVLTTTGCIQAYREAVLRRVLDLAQSTVVLWNQGFLTGSVVSARGLLETLAIYRTFLRRAESLATDKDWERISTLIGNYAFSRTDKGRDKKTGTSARSPDVPPPIGRAVKEFIAEAEPGKEQFWDQVCDTAHPNGFRTMELGGQLGNNRYVARPASEIEGEYFPAIYNALYACCWLTKANEDYEILLEVVRSGEPLPDHHPLIRERRDLDQLVRQLVGGPATSKG
jgi:hypothetical protein